MRKMVVFAALMLALTGCETSPVAPDAAKQVSQSNIYAFSRKSGPDDARIVFTQDSGIASCFGAGMSVYLDGKLAAETGQGQSVKLYHAPGPAQLSIKNNAMCAGGGQVGLVLDLRPGYSYQVRGYRDMWDKPQPLLGDPAPFKY